MFDLVGNVLVATNTSVEEPIYWLLTYVVFLAVIKFWTRPTGWRLQLRALTYAAFASYFFHELHEPREAVLNLLFLVAVFRLIHVDLYQHRRKDPH